MNSYILCWFILSVVIVIVIVIVFFNILYLKACGWAFFSAIEFLPSIYRIKCVYRFENVRAYVCIFGHPYCYGARKFAISWAHQLLLLFIISASAQLYMLCYEEFSLFFFCWLLFSSFLSDDEATTSIFKLLLHHHNEIMRRFESAWKYH